MYPTRMTYAHTKAHVYQPENAIKLKCKQIPADCEKNSYRRAFNCTRQVIEKMHRKTGPVHALLKFAKKIKLNYRNQKE
jgi:hypothetical protein